jgi:hypothetical protein
MDREAKGIVADIYRYSSFYHIISNFHPLPKEVGLDMKKITDKKCDHDAGNIA